MMKKKALAAAMMLVVLSLAACKEKRCRCVYDRFSERPSECFEPLDGHKSCSEVDKEWMASDSTFEIIKKTCVEEE